MANKTSEAQRAEWKRWVEEQDKSGLTQSAFCQKNNLSKAKFGYYKKIFLEHNGVSQGQLIPIHVNSSGKEADIQLTLPNGFQCRFPCHLSPLQLQGWLKVLLSC